MSDGLFDLEPEPRSPEVSAARVATDEQVRRLRELFESRGLNDQSGRKSYVERIANRPIAALRELTFVEARRVIELLEKPAPATSIAENQPQASSWDDREHDTWIDKL